MSSSTSDVYSRLFGRAGAGGDEEGKKPGFVAGWMGRKRPTTTTRDVSSHDPSDYVDVEALADDNVYAVRQKRGYLSIFFSVIQILILVLMVLSGGLAPLNVNPMIGPYPETLDDWGAKNAEKIVHDGEWWRVFPCPVFLHAGVIHLLGNVMVQLDMGAFFEREWGWIVWGVVYAGSGVGSSLLSVCLMPESIGVGSSGAVCGLFGAKLSEVLCRSCERRRTLQDRIGHEVRKEQLQHVLISVVVVGLFSFIPFVDWAAHLGGFLSGITIGIAFFSCMIRRKQVMVIGCVVGIVLTIIVYTMEVQHMQE